MIHRRELRTIIRGLMHVLNLRRNRGDAPLMQHGYFSGCRPHFQTARAAVITDPVDCRVIAHPVVVDIVNDCRIHVIYGAVIVESSPVPIPTFVTAADITIAIIDSTIEAYM